MGLCIAGMVVTRVNAQDGTTLLNQRLLASTVLLDIAPQGHLIPLQQAGAAATTILHYFVPALEAEEAHYIAQHNA